MNDQSFAFGFDSKSEGNANKFIPEIERTFFCMRKKTRYERLKEFIVYRFKKMIGRSIK